MPKFRFRQTIDIDIQAANVKEARNILKDRDRYPEDYELLGTAELEDLTPEMREASKSLGDFILMSVQYRGENFICMCKTKELDEERISVKPVALWLTEEQKDNITDVMGNCPEINKGENNE